MDRHGTSVGILGGEEFLASSLNQKDFKEIMTLHTITFELPPHGSHQPVQERDEAGEITGDEIESESVRARQRVIAANL